MEHTKLDIKDDKKGWESVVLRILKWLFILAVLVFIVLTVLARMGGNSEVLKEAVEEFLTNNTSYSASITTLNSMQFFPDIVVDVEGVELREFGANQSDDETTEQPEQQPQATQGDVVVTVEAAKVRLRFFDMIFKGGQFKNIELKNLSAVPGAILPVSMSLESLGIEQEDEGAFIKGSGSLNKKPMNVKIGLENKGNGLFTFGNDRAVNIDVGDLNIESSVKNTLTGALKFENLVISQKGVKALRANVDLDRQNTDRWSLKGQVRAYPDNSQLDPNIIIDKSESVLTLFGVIRSESLSLSDFNADQPFLKVIDALSAALSPAKDKAGFDFNGVKLDLNLDLKNIKSDKVVLGSLKTPLELDGNVLNAGPMDGKFIDGDLEGSATLDATKPSAKLSSKIIIRGFDYAALQKRFKQDAQIAGKADIILDLKSSGTTIPQLYDRLSGKVSFVGGKGEMRSGLLEFWGGGLLNALMPKLGHEEKLNLNCVVVNMDIENLKGRSDAVFIDTKRITLRGEGTYDFKNDVLDMLIEPNAKDIAIGDVSSALNVSGPLSDLSVKPNLFSLGKKLGGLALGAVNPAFYALTLTDLGLQDNHPCKQYVIEKEILPPPDLKPEKNTAAEAPAKNTPKQSAPANNE